MDTELHSVGLQHSSVAPPPPCPHPAAVPGLGFLSATGGDFLVLGLDLGDNLLHVQAAGVVHLHHHRRVLDAGLQLTQLLPVCGDQGGGMCETNTQQRN